MVKRLTRREFIRLATLSTVWVAGEGYLTSCQSPPVPQRDRQTGTTESPALATSHAPIGKGRGINPGRVVWAYNAEATRWDGQTGYWWSTENIDQAVVDEMVRASLCQLSGQAHLEAAWEAVFTHFNNSHRRSSVGYKPGEKIAVKVNMNTVTSHQIAHNNTFTAPHVVIALLKQLVEVVGVKAADIFVYDAVRYIPDCLFEAGQLPGLQGIHFLDFSGEQGREYCAPDHDCEVHWSEDVGGNPTYLPVCVTHADYLINAAGLKAHRLAGATLCAKNHCGTILAQLDNEPTMQSPQGANIHGFIAAKDYDSGPGWQWKKRPMGSYNALVDMAGHAHLGEKTVLFLLDGLYAAPHQQATLDNSARWQSGPFNGSWTSSLLMSMDGIAIDSVAYDFLVNEPTIAGNPDVMPTGHTTENYLHEAAQADAPPSGTVYCPDGEGHPIASLGVHEHWDSPTTRQYSRNRGDGEGIELVTLT